MEWSKQVPCFTQWPGLRAPEQGQAPARSEPVTAGAESASSAAQDKHRLRGPGSGADPATATVQVAQGGCERHRGRAAGLPTGLRVQGPSLFPSLPSLQCLDLAL